MRLSPQQTPKLYPDFGACDVSDSARVPLLCKSRSAFRTAARLNPKSANAFHGWGTMCLELGEYDEAITQLKQAVRLERDKLYSWNNLLVAAMLTGQKRLERTAWRQIRRSRRRDAEAFYLRSLAAYNRGDFYASIKSFRYAFDLSEAIPEAFLPLGEGLEAQRLSLLGLPTFSAQVSEYWQFQLQYWICSLKHSGRQVRPLAPKLVVGASVAAGISLIVYSPQGNIYSFSRKLELTEGKASVAIAHEKESAPANEGVAQISQQPQKQKMWQESGNASWQGEYPKVWIQDEKATVTIVDSEQVPQNLFIGSPVMLLNTLSPFYLASSIYANTNPMLDDDHYNLKVGPMTFIFTAASGVTFNDNVGLSQFKRSDTIFTTSLGILGAYPITDFSTFQLGVSLSYAKYLKDDGLSGFAFGVDPSLNAGKGIDLDFQVFIDRWTITLYNSASITADPFKEAAISDLSKLSSLTNKTGVNAVWDLSDVQVVLDGSRSYTNLLDTPGFSHLDRFSDNLTGAVKAQVRPWMNAGLNASYIRTSFDSGVRSGSITKGLGPTLELEVSDHITMKGTLMRTWTEFEADRRANRYINTGTFSINHEINALMEHSIGYSHTISPAFGVSSNTLVATNWDYRYSWNVSDVTDLILGINLQKGKEQFTASFERTDFSLDIKHQLDKHMQLGFGASHSFKETSDGRGDYKRNLFNLNMSYKF